jgi:CubicO group peptidase (beta-lactamase class C family)
MRLLKLFCLLLFVSLSSAAQTPPDTPAGRQLAGWLKAFNGNDRDAYREFLEKNFPSRVKGVERDWDFRERTGGFELRKIEDASTPTKLAALVQERGSDQFARLVLNVEPADPYRILDMALNAIPRPAEFTLPHLSENELVETLRKKLQEETAADRFAGAVLVAKNGKPIFAQAYGLADREHKISNTLETRFRIGSMNKMITAVATLQLVEAGKLGLNDPLGKYLTDYPNKDLAAKVTIHQLLTHQGGTGDFFGPEFDKHRLELRTLQDYVKLYGDRALKFEPGSRWEYSNYGFLLLGVVIEKVTGESYYTYVREHIYTPVGMVSTDSEPEDQVVKDRSIGYTKMGGRSGLQPNTETLPYRGTSAGGGYSTVEDLLKFANALQENKLLNAHSVEMLTTGKAGTPQNSYAYGFEEHTINGARCFGHGGGAPGMNGDLKICVNPRYVVVALANLDPPAATRISDFIANRLPKGDSSH